MYIYGRYYLSLEMSIVNLITLRVGVLVQKYGYIDLSENALVLNKKSLLPGKDQINRIVMIIKIETTKLENCMIIKFYFSVGISRKVVFVGEGGGGGGEMLSCGNI